MSAKALPGQVITLPFMANGKAVVRSVHRGGMGIVYELVPLVPVGVWALKTFRSSVDPDSFLRECKVWTALSEHPNVAPAIAYGEWQGEPAMLTHWYPAVLSRHATSTWNARSYVDAAAAILRVLCFAYDSFGVIHQDIKPSNVFIDHHGSVKVGDFGIARVASVIPSRRAPGEWSRSLTDTVTHGRLGGTPRYMAPELWSESTASSPLTDLYSFGVTFYELLTGQHPYQSFRLATDVQRMHRDALDTAARQIGGDLSQLSHLVEVCISLEPRRRPDSFRDALALLGEQIDSQIVDNGRSAAAGAVTRAQMLRAQGRFEEANDHLFRAAKALGAVHAPVLLNALGALKSAMATSRNDEHFLNAALLFFQAAWWALKQTQGRYCDQLYPDPIINAARLCIQRADADRAQEMLADVVEWATEIEMNVIQKAYPEIGWFYLYRGQLRQALHALRDAVAAHDADGDSLAWLVLTLRQMDLRPVSDDRIREWVERKRIVTVRDACIALIVAADMDRSARAKMRERISPQHVEAMREMANEIGMPQGAFDDLASNECQSVCLAILDTAATGGRYYGPT